MPPSNERQLVNSIVPEPGKEPEPLDLDRIDELKEKIQSQVLAGDDAILMLGWMVIGGSAEDWIQQGLELTKEAVMEAGRTLQVASREAFNTVDGQFSLAFDHHAIVASQQSVPDWFMEARERQLDLLPDDNRQAFERGQHYYDYVTPVA